jgi:GxxExxY protein
MNVLNEVKPGHDEKIFERALAIELRDQGHSVQQQSAFPVHYKGQLVGKLVPDMIIDGLIIVDPKVVTAFNETHYAQMLGYLTVTNLQLGLLINFKFARLDWKRIVKTR